MSDTQKSFSEKFNERFIFVMKSLWFYLKEVRKIYGLFFFIILGAFLYYFPKDWIEYGILPAIILIAFYYVALNLLVGLVRAFIVFVYKKRNKYSYDYYDNFILGIERVSFLVTNFLFFFLFLYLMNIEIKEFITSISIFAVALVLIFKEYISNMINGMIIMFSDEFKLKDYVKVGDYKGRIINVNFLNTEIKTDDGDVVFIPNTVMVSKEIMNYSKSVVKRIRYEFKLPISYSGKVQKLDDFIAKHLSDEFGSQIEPENVNLKILGVDKDQITLILEVVSQKYNFKFEERVKNKFSKFLLQFIDKENKKVENDKKL